MRSAKRVYFLILAVDQCLRRSDSHFWCFQMFARLCAALALMPTWVALLSSSAHFRALRLDDFVAPPSARARRCAVIADTRASRALVTVIKHTMHLLNGRAEGSGEQADRSQQWSLHVFHTVCAACLNHRRLGSNVYICFKSCSFWVLHSTLICQRLFLFLPSLKMPPTYTAS
jgi:hypothetical protein